MDKNIKNTDARLPEKQAESLLYTDVCSLIENTRQRLATTANVESCMMHWQIGKRIKEDVLYNKRAEYGKQIVKVLADKLTEKYGKSWSFYKLQHCVRSAYTFSKDQIRLEHWDTRILNEKIDSQLYKLTALSKKPEEIIKQELAKIKETNTLDLKLGKFKPAYEGQILLYLRYLNKNEWMEGEESPIGLILCSEGNTEHIEYLMLEDNNIRVAQYYTQLPDKKWLSEKLQCAIAIAKEHYANAAMDNKSLKQLKESNDK
jgi:hypothetical protein